VDVELIRYFPAVMLEIAWQLHDGFEVHDRGDGGVKVSPRL
jgi:hypothetical protein